jgi:carbamoyltransferase
MYILGISAFYHDSAACLLRDGELVCAVEEERLSRRKHDNRFPQSALRHCLSEGKIGIEDIDVVAFYENPRKKVSRQIWMGMQPQTPAEVRVQLNKRLDPHFVVRQIREIGGYDGPIDFVDHHESHAASSYFYSGFSDAAIMTFDGVGEWATTTYGAGNGAKLELFEETHFPHSLGLLYSAITSYLGFEVNEGEYKVMGLAPYGKPLHVEKLRKLLESDADGQFRLNLDYFDFFSNDRMYTPRLVELFGEPARPAESDLGSFHKDVAKSLQVVLEDVLLAKARYLHRKVPSKNLCMAGGVALNCVANGRILREGPFSDLFVQPAAGDDGAALGAAALVHARRTGAWPRARRLKHVYLGPAYTAHEVETTLSSAGGTALDFRGKEPELLEAVVDRLAAGKVVGWFHGHMEFGPRSLGARSILGDPRDAGMRDRINALVKMREAFRPFAPAALESKAAEHFEIDHASPFMLETCQVKSRFELPAITHVDGSARLQTVDVSTGHRFGKLLEAFDRRTGCPILLNTSFNVRGEPIVCTPEDAILCFARTKIDALVLEDFLIDRDALPHRWEEAAERMGIKGRSVSQSVYAMF